MEDHLKKRIRTLCRLEYLGAGFYAYLAGAYKKDRELSKILKTFSAHEADHGTMFSSYYAEICGQPPKAGPWQMAGKIMAFCQCIVPLKWKLKMLERVESQGVKGIEQAVASGEQGKLVAMLEKILPQEKAHAGLYKRLYG